MIRCNNSKRQMTDTVAQGVMLIVLCATMSTDALPNSTTGTCNSHHVLCKDVSFSSCTVQGCVILIMYCARMCHSHHVLCKDVSFSLCTVQGCEPEAKDIIAMWNNHF